MRRSFPKQSNEHNEQRTFFEWTYWHRKKYPQLDNCFAIPNGGYRQWQIGKKLKLEGVRAGVPDVFLAVPNEKYHGLFLEFKFGKNRMSDDQKEWSIKLEDQGYLVRVPYSFDEAREIVQEYLGISENLSVPILGYDI